MSANHIMYQCMVYSVHIAVKNESEGINYACFTRPVYTLHSPRFIGDKWCDLYAIQTMAIIITKIDVN